MIRKALILAALSGALLLGADRANAAVYVYYRYVPQPVLVPAPVVAYDVDNRFAGAYDVQGVIMTAVPYRLTLRVRDRIFDVALHNGTIIRPTGITLTPAMVVNMAGYWGPGGTFHADRIIVLRP